MPRHITDESGAVLAMSGQTQRSTTFASGHHAARKLARCLHLEQRCAGDGNGAAVAVGRDRVPSVIVNLSVR